MFGNENERILRLRNRISLCLDDLTALVVNSTLAAELRAFSEEIMELTPGFTFDQKQARELKDLTETTKKKYEAKAISDVDLMDYFEKARGVLKGERQETGGIKMPFMGLFDSKLNKLKAQYKELEGNYNEVSAKISALEEEKARSIQNAKGQSPDSIVYRNSERAYNSANNKQTLLKQQEVKLKQVLEGLDEQITLLEYADSQKKISRKASDVLGNEKDLSRATAQIEVENDRINSMLDRRKGISDSVFQAAQDDANATRTDSVFGAAVASAERRDAMLENSPFAQAMQAQAADAPKSDFDRQLSGKNNKD